MPHRHNEVIFVQPVLTGSTSNWYAVVQERRQFAHQLGFLIPISVSAFFAEDSHDSPRTPVT